MVYRLHSVNYFKFYKSRILYRIYTKLTEIIFTSKAVILFIILNLGLILECEKVTGQAFGMAITIQISIT